MNHRSTIAFVRYILLLLFLRRRKVENIRKHEIGGRRRECLVRRCNGQKEGNMKRGEFGSKVVGKGWMDSGKNRKYSKGGMKEILEDRGK